MEATTLRRCHAALGHHDLRTRQIAVFLIKHLVALTSINDGILLIVLGVRLGVRWMHKDHRLGALRRPIGEVDVDAG